MSVDDGLRVRGGVWRYGGGDVGGVVGCADGGVRSLPAGDP